MENRELLDALNAYGANTTAALERFVNDIELYNECLGLFFNDECFAKLAQALDAKEYKAAFDAAHTLKGVAGNLGLTPMYDSICEVVEPLRNHTYDHLTEAYERMLAEFQRLKDAIHWEK